MYKSDHCTHDHDSYMGVLKVHLNTSIDSDETLKRELLHMASIANDKGIKKILINNGDLSHPLNGELQKWVESSVELPLLRAGVDKIAIVMPGDKRMWTLTQHSDSQRKRYFKTERSAITWLSK